MAKKKPRKALDKDAVFVSVVGNLLTVNPIKVKTAHTGREVTWTCSGGRLDVDFTKDTSPYGANAFSSTGSGAEVTSGECVVKRKRTYNYTITVHPTGNKPVITIDPQVDVNDPGGPPGSYSGHGASGPAAKKAARRRPAAKKAARGKTARKKTARKRK